MTVNGSGNLISGSTLRFASTEPNRNWLDRFGNSRERSQFTNAENANRRKGRWPVNKAQKAPIQSSSPFDRHAPVVLDFRDRFARNIVLQSDRRQLKSTGTPNIFVCAD
jgi:hypothetical protein